MEVLRVVFVSAPKGKAETIAKAIADFRMAACVSIIPGVKSYYWWEDKLEKADEELIIIKTTERKVEALIDFVKKHHPNEIPEILTLPVAEGLPAYVSWVIEEMGKGSETL